MPFTPIGGDNIKIKTYKELNEELSAFNKGHIKLLIIEGESGIGKSFLSDKLIEEPLVFRGHTTPFRFVQKLYETPDCCVIIDDVLSFLKNKQNVGLMLQLCELNEVNDIYHDTTRTYKGSDFPSPYQSYHNIIVIINSLGEIKDPSLRAVLNRGVKIDFCPDRDEIYSQMGDLPDREIVKFMAEYRGISRRFDFRLYKIAKTRKEAGLSWEKFLISEMEIDKKLVLMKKLLIKYDTDKERVSHYKHSESDFYRTKRRLARLSNCQGIENVKEVA